jgi:hypothetical protein
MERQDSSLARRDFLRIGTLGTAAAALGTTAFGGVGSLIREAPPSFRIGLGADAATSTLLLEPGIMSAAQVSGAITHRTPWALPVDAEPFIDRLMVPIVPDVDAIAAWSSNDLRADTIDARDTTTSTLSTIARFPILGGESNIDFSSQVIDAMRSDSQVQMTFFAFDNAIAPNSVINRGPIPILDDRPLVSPSRIRTEAAPSWTSKAVSGWRLQYRGQETHPLPSCVGAGINVKHIHLEVCHNEPLGSSRWPVKSTLHLGTYRLAGRRCFVLYLDRPRVCIRPCNPTMNDLYQILVTALYVAAGIAALAIAGWIVASIASAAASALYLPLLLLV